MRDAHANCYINQEKKRCASPTIGSLFLRHTIESIKRNHLHNDRKRKAYFKKHIIYEQKIERLIMI